jgi:hypothetical protein
MKRSLIKRRNDWRGVSRAEKLRKRRLHKSPIGLKPAERRKKVARMREVLGRQGWTFEFSVQASSPRGFRYSATGDSPEECFLRAFGEWKSEMLAAVPRFPAALEAISKPSNLFYRKYKRRNLGHFLKRHGRASYMRNYMRMYRAEKMAGTDGVLRASYERVAMA